MSRTFCKVIYLLHFCNATDTHSFAVNMELRKSVNPLVYKYSRQGFGFVVFGQMSRMRKYTIIPPNSPYVMTVKK